MLTRYPKLTRGGDPRLDHEGTWIDGPEQQLRKELARLVDGQVATVRPIEGDRVPWHRFQRRRHRGEGRRGPDKAFGFEVDFTEEVTGPIAVGYGRFFGLGQFVPVRERD